MKERQGPVGGGPLGRVGRAARAVWREVLEAGDWLALPYRRRPRLSERSSIEDPVAGYGPREPWDDERDAERGEPPGEP